MAERKLNKSYTDVVESKTTGKQRAEARQQALRDWQATFYENAEPINASRQYRRWVSRYTKSKEAAMLKAQALKQRRQKVADPLGVSPSPM
jgi:hypothetical protein